MKRSMADDPVRRALAALADADASRHAPPHLEREILDALERRASRGYSQSWLARAWTYRYGAAAIALLVATSTVYFVKGQLDRPVLSPASPAGTLEQGSVHLEPDTQLARRADGDVAQRVLVRLPRAMLPMLGVPVINPDAPGTVNLEVVLREDGLAETIRIVP